MAEQYRNNENGSVNASCGRCEENMQRNEQSMTEMEQHYKEKIKQAKAALDERQKQFDSFKKRMGVNPGDELNTGDCESMDSPVSETRLNTMHGQMITKWQKVLTKEEDINLANKLIQGMFAASTNDMEKEKQQIEDMFKLDGTSPPPKEVAEYKTMAVQNLQMAVYHSRKEDVVEKYQVREMVTDPKEFKDLAAEFYWLGCLKALNPNHPTSVSIVESYSWTGRLEYLPTCY